MLLILIKEPQLPQKERWIPLASSPVPSTCVLMTESGSL